MFSKKVQPLKEGSISQDTKSNPNPPNKPIVQLLSTPGIEYHQSPVSLCQTSLTNQNINESQTYPINNVSPNPSKEDDQSSSSIRWNNKDGINGIKSLRVINLNKNSVNNFNMNDTNSRNDNGK